MRERRWSVLAINTYAIPRETYGEASAISSFSQTHMQRWRLNHWNEKQAERRKDTPNFCLLCNMPWGENEARCVSLLPSCLRRDRKSDGCNRSSPLLWYEGKHGEQSGYCVHWNLGTRSQGCNIQRQIDQSEGCHWELMQISPLYFSSFSTKEGIGGGTAFPSLSSPTSFISSASCSSTSSSCSERLIAEKNTHSEHTHAM